MNTADMTRSRRDREELLAGRNDDIEDIEYGIRQSRRNTSFHYRDSSSLTPAQFMEQEMYYHFAAEVLEHSVHIGHIIGLSVSIYHWYNAIVGRLHTLRDGVSDSIAAARRKLQLIKNAIDKLSFTLSWITSYGELAYLYAEDLAVFIRRRHRFGPERFRRLGEIESHDCYAWFGLNPFGLRRLYLCWRVPTTFRTTSGKVYGGEECFLVMLFHFIKGTPFTQMARLTFGGDPRRLSEMFDLMIDHLYFTFYHKISGVSLDQWIPRYLHTCRRLIFDAISDGALEETLYVDGVAVDRQWILHHFDFDTFRPFAFGDDMAMPTARPGDSATRNSNFAQDIQRAFYSGYLRCHGLKAQVVYLPIGIIGAVFITELRQNDNGVQNMSGLNNYLLQLLSGILVGGLFPCIYVDGIFRLLATILPRFVNPTIEERFLNIRFASLRECIEHVFADHHNRFQLFDVPHRLHLFNRGVKVRRMCLVSFFILNSFYCLDGTRCCYFGHIPPTLEDYLPLDEVLSPPPAVNLGAVWDYGPTAN